MVGVAVSGEPRNPCLGTDTPSNSKGPPGAINSLKSPVKDTAEIIAGKYNTYRKNLQPFICLYKK